MRVIERRTPVSSQHGAIPKRSLPEDYTVARSSTFVQRIWGIAGANPAWLALAPLLLVFWLYKLRDLPLPFFWDELGVYGRAALYMHDHGLGLLPSYLPPDLSRGHPLLLPFVFGALFRVFGATPLVAHVGMLLVSTGLVVSVFWIAHAHWNATVGLASGGLLLAQPLFLAQSTLVLPEIPLSLACLWAMHAFSRKSFFQAGLFISMAILLKETAVVLSASLAVILIARWLGARPSLKSALGGILALAIPDIVYCSFLLIQKHQNGWYLYPFHESQVNFHWSAMKSALVECISSVFVEQGRLALSVIVALWIFFRMLGRREGQRRFVPSLAWSFAVFSIGILVFSAGNVFMKRYLLCLLPPLSILSSRALFELVHNQPRVLVPAALGLGLLCLADLTSARFNCAYDMGFRQSVLLQQEATRYLEDVVGPDKAILANFPTVFGLEDPRYGYTPERFKRSSSRYSPEAEYIFASEIFDPFTPPEGVRTELVKRFASPYMNIGLYRILR